MESFDIYKLSYSMTHIIDTIYLGNALDASYYYSLKEHNIGAIVNVTTEIPNYFEDDFSYFNIIINDLNSESFSKKNLQNVLEFINNFQENNKDKNILIHCYMGSSRSATIVLLYLIRKHNYTIEQALEYIKEKRNIVNLNTQFLEDIKNFL